MVSDLERALRQALPDLPFLRKAVFGCPTFFAGSRHFAVIWEHSRLVLCFQQEEPAIDLLKLPGAEVWVPSSRHPPATRAAILPPELALDPEALAPWARLAYGQALAAGPKARRRR